MRKHSQHDHYQFVLKSQSLNFEFTTDAPGSGTVQDVFDSALRDVGVNLLDIWCNGEQLLAEATIAEVFANFHTVRPGRMDPLNWSQF